MTITLRNEFHGSAVNVRVHSVPVTLTASQTKRVYRELCGMRDCTCGGLRGIQQGDGKRIDWDITWEAGDKPGHAQPRIELWERE